MLRREEFAATVDSRAGSALVVPHALSRSGAKGRMGLRSLWCRALVAVEGDGMTRGRFHASAMPLLGVLYAMALVLSSHNGTVIVIGAMLFAVVAIAGTALRSGRSI